MHLFFLLDSLGWFKYVVMYLGLFKQFYVDGHQDCLLYSVINTALATSSFMLIFSHIVIVVIW